MKICRQCGCEMVEGFNMQIKGSAFGIKITKGTGIFPDIIGEPKVAICPKCGEISLYVENVDEI